MWNTNRKENQWEQSRNRVSSLLSEIGGRGEVMSSYDLVKLSEDPAATMALFEQEIHFATDARKRLMLALEQMNVQSSQVPYSVREPIHTTTMRFGDKAVINLTVIIEKLTRAKDQVSRLMRSPMPVISADYLQEEGYQHPDWETIQLRASQATQDLFDRAMNR